MKGKYLGIVVGIVFVAFLFVGGAVGENASVSVNSNVFLSSVDGVYSHPESGMSYHRNHDTLSQIWAAGNAAELDGGIWGKQASGGGNGVVLINAKSNNDNAKVVFSGEKPVEKMGADIQGDFSVKVGQSQAEMYGHMPNSDVYKYKYYSSEKADGIASTSYYVKTSAGYDGTSQGQINTEETESSIRVRGGVNSKDIDETSKYFKIDSSSNLPESQIAQMFVTSAATPVIVAITKYFGYQADAFKKAGITLGDKNTGNAVPMA